MTETSKTRGFWGQATLLLLPVLVLVAVGWNSIRQERLLVHREAVENAQRLAHALLTESAAALAQSPSGAGALLSAFQVDNAGRLVFPPPVGVLHPKPLFASALPTEQAVAWRTARAAEAQPRNLAAVIAAYRAFLRLQPPADFTANAAYSLGLRLMEAGDPVAAAAQFKRVVDSTPESSESGLPLDTLARFKLFELQPNLPAPDWSGTADSLSSNLVQQSSPLTPILLRKAALCATNAAAAKRIEEWTQLWQRHELLRDLYGAVRFQLATNPLAVWFVWEEIEASRTTNSPSAAAARHWLAVSCRDASGGRWYQCLPEAEAATWVREAVARATVTLDYFGVAVKVADRLLISDAPPASESLASASRSEGGHEWLRVEVFLSQPARLDALQRNRRFSFALLIALAAGAALLGLWANWRAFQRQQRLSELKSNFVSSVSHELRTPVASVRVLAEGLESGKVSGPWKQQQYLRLITQECRRLSCLIENILDFSRIEQGRKQFDFAPTDVRSLVEQTVCIIEPYAAERKVPLALALPPAEATASRPPPVMDGRAIQQALLNLIDNAVKHSPDGESVTIGMDWLCQEQARGAADGQGGGMALWVEDRGGGIPLEEHEKIFERFYRRGSEMRRETQGVGIGLSLVKHTVEAHGGRVRVRSAVGQGSRFTLELPSSPPQEESTHERR